MASAPATRSIVLLNAITQREERLLPWMRFIFHAPPYAALYHAMPMRRRMFRRLYADASAADEAFAAYWFSARFRGHHDAYARLVRDLRHDMPPPQCGTPTLILWGGRDRILSLSRARELQRSMSKADLRVIAGSGHMLAEEQPDAVNGAILEAARRTFV
jgi:pimeloyl-ACP methyl ester carboxylesterase